MAPRVLLVNPPVYDFTAYDFWLKPYGLLTVGGFLRGRAELRLFDYLDRLSPLLPGRARLRADPWGRGPLHCRVAVKPAVFADLRRRWRRYGLPQQAFGDFLAREGPFDFALVGTGMTYWYPGVSEVIEDLRRASPATRIVLGGLYATLCGDHARRLGGDLVVAGDDLAPLWGMMGVEPDPGQPPFWEGYARLATGVLKLTDGCPYRCTYCCVPLLWPGFRPRPAERAIAELELLLARGADNVAFYDDALLHAPQAALVPFLQELLRRGLKVNLHTPNALHARLVTAELAETMVRAGFKTFYLGFESASDAFQRATGGKVDADDLARAVARLRSAGAGAGSITVYIILGHPDHDRQEVAASMRRVHSLGARIMLAEFSPVPGTADARAAARWADLEEPLWHNKTAFTLARLGRGETERLKGLCRELNSALAAAGR